MTYRLTRRQAIAGLARAGAVAVLPLDAIAAAKPAPPPAVARASIVALPPLEAMIEPEPALPTAGTTACAYPGSNPTRRLIRDELNAIAANKSKCTSFYLDTKESHSSESYDHHQGLARTHRLSDGSIYFFLAHSEKDPRDKGNLMQFRYAGPTSGEHAVQTSPMTVAPLMQLLEIDEQHPSDIAFLPDMNNADAGYLFVTEEEVTQSLSVYRWNPTAGLALRRVIKNVPRKPNFMFIDRVGTSYYLGVANNHTREGKLYVAQGAALFPTCNPGSMDIGAFKEKSLFDFDIVGQPSQVKLVRDASDCWYLLAFRSDEDDDPHGDDYVDVYGVILSPFSISPRLYSVHIYLKPGDTGFASTGTHYVERSGRLLVSSSYRWSKDEGPGASSYVSRVDECPSS